MRCWCAISWAGIASQDLRSVIYPLFMFMICLCVSDKFIEYHEVQVLQASAVAKAPVLVPPFKKVPPIKIDSSLQEIRQYSGDKEGFKAPAQKHSNSITSTQMSALGFIETQCELTCKIGSAVFSHLHKVR